MVFYAVCTTVLLIVVIMTSRTRGLSRFALPSSLMSLMLITIFGVRPLVLAAKGPSNFYDLLTFPGWTTAGQIGLVTGAAAAAGAVLGNLVPSRRASAATRRRSTPSDPKVEGAAVTPILHKNWRLRSWTATVLGVAGWLLLVVLVSGPSGIQAQLGGRSANATASVTGLPVIAFLLPLAGSIVSAILIVVQARGGVNPQASRRAVLATSACLTAISVACTLGLGNRRFIIPALLIPLIAYILSNRAKFKLIPALLATVVLVFLAILPYVRAVGARRPGEGVFAAAWRYFEQGSGLSSVFTDYFTSYDTEMFDYLAFLSQKMGTAIPWGHGRALIVETVLSPLPSSWLSGPLFSDQLLLHTFGSTCTGGPCPVLSLPGTAYVDFGLWGVLVVLLLVTFALRRMEWRLLCPRQAVGENASLMGRSAEGLVALAIVAAYMPIIARTDSAVATGWLCISLVILWMLGRLVVVRGAPHKSDIQKESVPTRR